MLNGIRENVRLAPYTSLRIGGIARYFADITNEEQLSEALSFAEQERLSVFVLGGGSNVLIADVGFSGLVLRIALEGIIFRKSAKEAGVVTAAAGENWDFFVQKCIERNLAGIECLSGIPGLVGGTPIQNVGAYGQEVSETIVSVRGYDRQRKAVVDLSNRDCQFGYRTSIFNTTEKDRYIVLGVTFKLRPHGEPTLRYIDLQIFFAPNKLSPSLQQTRDAVLNIRASKAMVIKPNDPDSQSVGSFFKNPIIEVKEFDRLQATSQKLNLLSGGEVVPHFVLPEERIKIPAAWLIEKAGFKKGYERGRVGISSKHTLAIVNRSNATATEIVEFANKIQAKVRELFGISLMPEPVFIGFK